MSEDFRRMSGGAGAIAASNLPPPTSSGDSRLLPNHILNALLVENLRRNSQEFNQATFSPSYFSAANTGLQYSPFAHSNYPFPTLDQIESFSKRKANEDLYMHNSKRTKCLPTFPNSYFSNRLNYSNNGNEIQQRHENQNPVYPTYPLKAPSPKRLYLDVEQKQSSKTDATETFINHELPREEESVPERKFENLPIQPKEFEDMNVQVKSETDFFESRSVKSEENMDLQSENVESESVEYCRDEFDEELPDSVASNPDNSTEASKIRCPLCNAQIYTFDYRQHLRNHNPLACSNCEFIAETDDHLNDHKMSCIQNSSVTEKSAPLKKKKRKCKTCGVSIEFTTDDEWFKHRRIHIRDDKLLACNLCSFITDLKHHFEYHMNNHTGQKNFKCNKCSYKCVNQSMLNSHMKSHSNFYSFRCMNCNYEAKYMHALKIHCRKYEHSPMPAFNPDGSINPFPIIDVYGTRRGPKVKRDAQGNPIFPPQYTAKISVRTSDPNPSPVVSSCSPITSNTTIPSTSSVNVSSSQLLRYQNPPQMTQTLTAFPGMLSHPPSFYSTPPSIPSLTHFSYLNSPNSPLTANPSVYAALSAGAAKLNTIVEDKSKSFKCTICSDEFPSEEILKFHEVFVHVAKGSPAPGDWQTPTRAPQTRRLLNDANSAQLIERIIAAKMSQQQEEPANSPLLDLLVSKSSKMQDQKEQEIPVEDGSSSPLDLTKDHTPPQQIKRRLSEPPCEISPSSLTPPDTISPKKAYRAPIPVKMEPLAEEEEMEIDTKETESQISGASNETEKPKITVIEPKEYEEKDFVMDCSLCKITFRSENMYTTHMKFHGETDPLRCSFCQETLADSNKFFEHCYSCKSR